MARMKLCAYCDQPAAGLIVQGEYEVEPGILAYEDLDVCADHFAALNASVSVVSA